ncbi:hypothetical protein KDL01_32810 [Actinospica durhamensis]|uniref:Serine/threonine protein kinase n=1 Tax=Actinospica durhamensis TaxID=1508375 RepID=A0A941ETK1_9ACTN|nr:hypothetical protein [Actinospica durhamensis]MBR7838100.1 hypothetical protein [Actinospica durhamensis]
MTIPYAARASLGLAALALGASTLAGCASQRLQNSPATVSTAGASAAAADALSTTCPSTAPTNLSSNASGLAAQLEPLTATRVLLCVYPAASPSESATDESPTANPTAVPAVSTPATSTAAASSAASPTASAKAPTAIVLTKTDQIDSLQRALNALTPPPTQPVSCPMDTGSSVLVIFTAGAQETEVLIQTSGCPLAANGQKTGWVGQTDFLSILSSLVGGSS